MAVFQDHLPSFESRLTLKDEPVISVLPISTPESGNDSPLSIPNERALEALLSDLAPQEIAFVPSPPIGKHSRRIDVRPLGWETSKETEVLPLTLLGQTMPKIYGLIVEIFKLPELITVEQQESIVENLRRGLEKTLQQYPIMVGIMEWDEKSGEIGVRKNRNSAVGFEVRYMDGDIDAFPTFSQLESRHVCLRTLTLGVGPLTVLNSFTLIMLTANGYSQSSPRD